jgi:hypothetical protein
MGGIDRGWQWLTTAPVAAIQKNPAPTATTQICTAPIANTNEATAPTTVTAPNAMTMWKKKNDCLHQPSHLADLCMVRWFDARIHRGMVCYTGEEMNLDEYRRRIEAMHTITGIPSYWEELQAMTIERDTLKALVLELQIALHDTRVELHRLERENARGQY